MVRNVILHFWNIHCIGWHMVEFKYKQHNLREFIYTWGKICWLKEKWANENKSGVFDHIIWSSFFSPWKQRAKCHHMISVILAYLQVIQRWKKPMQMCLNTASVCLLTCSLEKHDPRFNTKSVWYIVCSGFTAPDVFTAYTVSTRAVFSILTHSVLEFDSELKMMRWIALKNTLKLLKTKMMPNHWTSLNSKSAADCTSWTKHFTREVCR